MRYNRLLLAVVIIGSWMLLADVVRHGVTIRGHVLPATNFAIGLALIFVVCLAGGTLLLFAATIMLTLFNWLTTPKDKS